MNEGTDLSCTFPASAASAFALGMKERKKFSTQTDKKFKNQCPVLTSQNQAKRKPRSLSTIPSAGPCNACSSS